MLEKIKEYYFRLFLALSQITISIFIYFTVYHKEYFSK